MNLVVALAMLAAGLGVSTGPPGRADPVDAPRTGYVWPLRPQPEVIRRFEPPPAPWAPGHRGVDLLGVEGARVHAAGAGVVSFSGVIAGRGTVAVLHANGWRTTYEPVSRRVAAGTRVSAGDVIGMLDVANSHCAPRTCLHWGLVVAKQTYRDPLTLLRPSRVILLPVP